MNEIDHILTIELENGESRAIAIGKFPAMDGWDIQHRYLEFVSTSDKDLRRAYTLEVLSHAAIIVNDTRIPINTVAVVENHLRSWEAINIVFRTILERNGINPDTHADRPGYWEQVGGDMAVAFITNVVKLMGPAMEQTIKDQESQG
jgi:hypothetical protein